MFPKIQDVVFSQFFDDVIKNFQDGGFSRNFGVLKKRIANFQKQISKNDKTMIFCKKCHRSIVEKFNELRNYVWESVKVCECNIRVVGNDDSPKVVVQRRKGIRKMSMKPVGT